MRDMPCLFWHTKIFMYDIAIIGAGVSGVFAALRLAEKHKQLKVIVFDFGPPPSNCLRQDPINVKRRRRQLEGWLGCFPTGDGKLYIDEDANKVLSITDGRRVRIAKEWISDKFNSISPLAIIKNKSPIASVKHNIKNNGFELKIHEYDQWTPDLIHQLSKISADTIEDTGNIFLSFETEVFGFNKSGKNFTIQTSEGEFESKKVILGAGRSGWRWMNKIYKSLDLLKTNTIAKYGIKVEMPGSTLKDYNNCHCSISKEGLNIGPLEWEGSIIQEDHEDMTLAAFRSNENRWKTDKVFFSIEKQFEIKSDVCEYVDRIAKLSHLLSGDRVGREKIKHFIKGIGDLVEMPEYNWIEKTVSELECILPNITSRGYFHVPSINTSVNNINISSNLETDIEGLFIAGESTGIKGIAAAAIMGVVAAEGVIK
jgi:hypothetical protein